MKFEKGRTFSSLFRITKVTSVSNVTLYAHLESNYLTFNRNTGGTYLLNGTTAMSGSYFLYWVNTASSSKNVKITVKMKYDGDTSGASCVGLTTSKNWYDNYVLTVNGAYYYQTKSVTISVPSGYYICILNENDVTGYYTAEIVP